MNNFPRLPPLPPLPKGRSTFTAAVLCNYASSPPPPPINIPYKWGGIGRGALPPSPLPIKYQNPHSCRPCLVLKIQQGHQQQRVRTIGTSQMSPAEWTRNSRNASNIRDANKSTSISRDANSTVWTATIYEFSRKSEQIKNSWRKTQKG